MSHVDTDWRRRYETAMDRIETETDRWATVESLLRRIVNRLCIAAQGIDARLDAELSKVSRVMREPAEAAALGGLLDKLSGVIASLDDSTARTAPATPPAASVPAAAPVPPVAISPPAVVASSAAAAAVAAAVAAGPPADAFDFSPIAEALLAIVDRMPPSEGASSEITALRNELSDPSLGADVVALAARVAQLVATERQRLEREKEEAERILGQVTARLDDIAQFIAGSDSEHADSRASSTSLNERVLGEVRELGGQVQQATSLTLLQQHVRARLEAINTHFVEFRSREEQRQQSYRERTTQMRRRIEELESATRALETNLRNEQMQAMRDALTGIPNRAAFDERIDLEWKRWRRFGRPLSLIVADLDLFKRVNDTYGHRAGDKVLRVVAQHLGKRLRETDFVARYGGEEFVLILVGAPLEAAERIARSIREEVGGIGFHFHGKPVSVTLSVGLTSFRADDTPAQAFERADRALYEAKNAGRNRCLTA